MCIIQKTSEKAFIEFISFHFQTENRLKFKKNDKKTL